MMAEGHGDALELALAAAAGSSPRELGPRVRLAISRAVMAAAQHGAPAQQQQQGAGAELLCAPWLVPRLLANGAAASPALLQVREDVMLTAGIACACATASFA